MAIEKILGEFQPESEQMKWGKIHEPLLLEEFRQRTGLPCVPGVPFLKNTALPDFINANCDGIGGRAELHPEYVVEAKQSRFGDGFGPDGTDQIPDLYNIQIHHQMLVTGAQVGYLIVLIGGNNCRLYEIPYNPAIMQTALPILEEFWNDYVLKRRLPEPDFRHPATAKLVKKLVPLMSDLELKFDELDEHGQGLYDLAGMYELMTRIETAAKQEKESLKSQMRVRSGGAGLIQFPDGTKVTLKMQNRKGYVVQPSSFEVMRLNWKGDPQNGYQKIGVEPLALGDSRPGEEEPNH